jgi:hypothetical protein
MDPPRLNYIKPLRTHRQDWTTSPSIWRTQPPVGVFPFARMWERSNGRFRYKITWREGSQNRVDRRPLLSRCVGVSRSRARALA